MERTRSWQLLPAIIIALCLLQVGCKQENTVDPPEKKPLTSVFNLQAYSRSATSVGLKWNITSDTSRQDYIQILEVQARVRTPENNLLYTLRMPKTRTDTIVVGLDEGKIYTFEIVTVPSQTSTDYKESEPAVIRWAPARRIGPLDVFEIGSTANASGLQFFDGGTLNARVLPIGPGIAQQLIDVLVDTNASGDIILESAHRNPQLQPGVVAKRTRFSTVEGESPDLNTPRAAQPDTTTYIRDNVLIFPSQVQNGKILFAVTNDKNYVRLLVQRDPTTGTLVFGSPPNRSVSILLSYQTIPNVIYVRPQGQEGEPPSLVR
jgi:hypothetical protein